MNQATQTTDTATDTISTDIGTTLSDLPPELPRVAATGEPTIALQSLPEDTVKVPEYDPATDTYVYKEVSRDQFVITAQQMTERAYEGQNEASILETGGYSNDFHHVWIPKRTDLGAYADARKKGYAPVRKTESGAHSVAKVEGLAGEIVVCGDLMLMACPKYAYEIREDARLALRRQEQLELRNPHQENIENLVDGDRVAWRNKKHTVQFAAVAEQFNTDRTEMMIQSRERAEAYADTYTKPNSRSFGGFNPSPNSPVQDSPNLRPNSPYAQNR